MYYCQTRYYVPEWGRWLNADNVNFLQFDNINGMNLFAYCGNNPIMYADKKGTIGILASLLIGAFIGASFGAVEGVISAKIAGRDIVYGALIGAVSGALLGGIANIGTPIIVFGFASLLAGGVSEYFNQKVNGEEFNLVSITWAGIKTSVSNMASLAFANYINKFAIDAFDIFGTTLGMSIIFFGINLLFDLIDVSSLNYKNEDDNNEKPFFERFLR